MDKDIVESDSVAGSQSMQDLEKLVQLSELELAAVGGAGLRPIGLISVEE